MNNKDYIKANKEVLRTLKHNDDRELAQMSDIQQCMRKHHWTLMNKFEKLAKIKLRGIKLFWKALRKKGG